MFTTYHEVFTSVVLVAKTPNNLLVVGADPVTLRSPCTAASNHEEQYSSSLCNLQLQHVLGDEAKRPALKRASATLALAGNKAIATLPVAHQRAKFLIEFGTSVSALNYSSRVGGEDTIGDYALVTGSFNGSNPKVPVVINAAQCTHEKAFKEAITQQCDTQLPGMSTVQSKEMREALYASKAPHEKGDVMHKTSAAACTMFPCYDQDPTNSNKYIMRLSHLWVFGPDQVFEMEAITQQCGTQLPGLSTALTKGMLEALYASKAPYEKADLMYMTSAVGYTLLPSYDEDPENSNKYIMRLRHLWVFGPDQVFEMDGSRVNLKDTNLLVSSDQQIELLFKVTDKKDGTMLFHPPEHWEFPDHAVGLVAAKKLFLDILPRLYGEDRFPAVASMYNIMLLPFLRWRYAKAGILNMPFVVVFGPPGSGKRTGVGIILQACGQPTNSAMQEVTGPYLHGQLSLCIS